MRRAAIHPRRQRVAFVTPEFPSEPGGGGLATYVNRMTRALRDAGHHPEVFVLSGAAGTLDWDGVPVHRVCRADRSLRVRALLRLCRLLRRPGLASALLMLADARRLAHALARRERRGRFDLVQSCDYLGAGLFVRRSSRRPHVVRASSASDLLARANGEDGARRSWRVRIERACLRRADRVYAPSRFVADHLAGRGARVAVLRPPARLEAKPDAEGLPPLPERYLVHFGQLAGTKGTPELAAALPLVWDEAPDFRMVWAGSDHRHPFASWAAGWGDARDRVVWLGSLPKAELFALLQGAVAAVLPSRVDNLPNGAIECLQLGVPVIGSDGASLDELVEPGITGELVPLGDVEALARSLLRAWRGEWSVRPGFRWRSPLADAMQPHAAVEALLRFAGLTGPLRTGGWSPNRS